VFCGLLTHEFCGHSMKNETSDLVWSVMVALWDCREEPIGTLFVFLDPRAQTGKEAVLEVVTLSILPFPLCALPRRASSASRRFNRRRRLSVLLPVEPVGVAAIQELWRYVVRSDAPMSFLSFSSSLPTTRSEGGWALTETMTRSSSAPPPSSLTRGAPSG